MHCNIVQFIMIILVYNGSTIPFIMRYILIVYDRFTDIDIFVGGIPTPLKN